MLNQAKEFRLGRQWNRDIKSSAFASILFPMQLMAPLNLRAYSNALIFILEHLLTTDWKKKMFWKTYIWKELRKSDTFTEQILTINVLI